MRNDFSGQNSGHGPGRFVGAVFGFVFLGIGLTVLGFLWGAPFGEFGSPPLVFRIFGSFIAIAFVAMGGATAYSAVSGMPQNSVLRPRSPIQDEQRRSGPRPSADPPKRGIYSCENCGATLGSNADVSPRGDVKCAHCGRWFNVHAE